MTFKETKFSELGFVLPDFDFDSSDALVATTNPSFEMIQLQFDLLQIFDSLNTAVLQQDTTETKRQLGFFRAAIVQRQRLSEDIVTSRPFAQLFETLIRQAPREILYETLCALCAWTGSQNIDVDYYASEGMMNFLMETSIVAISSPVYDGDRRTGRAAVGVLRNLVFHSNQCRIEFLKKRGADLFGTLYYEVTDIRLQTAILSVIQNSLLVMKGDDRPPIEIFDPVLELLTHVFGFNIAMAEATEIELASAYVDCGKDFALRLLKTLDFESLSVRFPKMARDTQVSVLELLKKYVCWDRSVAALAGPKIDWGIISAFIRKCDAKKVHKKFCEVVKTIFETYGPDTCPESLSVMFPSVFYLVENQPLRVRVMAIDTISVMVRSRARYILDIVVGHGIVSKICGFLEAEWNRLMILGVEMLLYAVQYALDGRCRRQVLQEIDENELGMLLEEAASREGLSEEAYKLIELLQQKITELVHSPLDPIEVDQSDEDDGVIPMAFPVTVEENVPSEPESESECEWEDA